MGFMDLELEFIDIDESDERNRDLIEVLNQLNELAAKAEE